MNMQATKKFLCGVLLPWLLLPASVSLQAAENAKTRLQRAEALFQERCKTAGEKTHRTADNVEGILTGGEGRDNLLGGVGDDTLEGGQDSDLLQGGAGDDTYLFTSGDGWDWIEDSDGIGHIEIDGLTLHGGPAVGDSGQVWQETQGGKTFTYLLSDWTENGQTFQRLAIQGPNGGLFVKGWRAGQLGLNLPGAPVPPSPAADLNGTADNDNSQLRQTAHLATLQSTAPNQKVYGQGGADSLKIDQAGSAGYGGTDNDLLTDGAGSDFILGGGNGIDQLQGIGSNDDRWRQTA